ncbi:MAG: glycosyltransferase family 2 protein [Bacteroidales bacterium]|nr:glycosyltransferase family 2 protein [Bacteroidales bacterium]
MTNYPKVAVIIPTYNRYPVICRAIDSVFIQSYSNIDCLVIDDGSTDNTAQLLKDKYSSSIHIYRNKSNKEKAYSRNRGVKETDAEYICFLDSDDTLTKNSIERRLYSLLSCSESCSASFGIRLDASYNNNAIDRYRNIMKSGDILSLDQYLSDKKWLSTNSFLISRNLMLTYGMYNEKLANNEDVELFIRLLTRIEFCFCGTAVTRIFDDAKNRARNNFDKIIKHGTMFSEILENNHSIAKKIEKWMPSIKKEEYAELLGALYHSGRYKEFRKMFNKGLNRDLTPKTVKFYKRYALSYLRATF